MSKEQPKYDDKDTCPICKGWNDVQITAIVGGYIGECETRCKKCGHINYWAYGYFNQKMI